MRSNTCYCGHVEDEHDDKHACTIDGCDCFHYEEDPDAQ